MPAITLHRQVRLDNSYWIGSLQKWPTIPGVLGGRSGTGCQAATLHNQLKPWYLLILDLAGNVTNDRRKR